MRGCAWIFERGSCAEHHLDRPSAGGVSELADLPDATGVAFTSELFIDFFDTDQVLENCEDIELITANIEHSFIGDLSFWITCPDGTEVLLMDNGASRWT